MVEPVVHQAWRHALDTLREALGIPLRDGTAQLNVLPRLNQAVRALPLLHAGPDGERLREEANGLLRDASTWLQSADCTVTEMVDERQPWQLVVLLAGFAVCLSRLCDIVCTQAQLSDSKVVYALRAGQLALLTGSALRVQQQLESHGSECQLHTMLSVLLIGNGQRMRQALRGNTAALRAAFGCGLLQRSSELLQMATLPLHAAATAALVRTAAKPAVLLPWLAQLLPSVQRLCEIDPTNAGVPWLTIAPSLATTLLGTAAFQSCYLDAVSADVAVQEQLALACLTALECSLQRLDSAALSGPDDDSMCSTSLAAAPSSLRHTGAVDQLGGGNVAGQLSSLRHSLPGGTAAAAFQAASQLGSGQDSAGAPVACDGLASGLAAEPGDVTGLALLCSAVGTLRLPALAAGLNVVAAGPRGAQLLDSTVAALQHLVGPAGQQHFGSNLERAFACLAALAVTVSAQAGQQSAAGGNSRRLQALGSRLVRLMPDAIAALRLAAADELSRTHALTSVIVTISQLTSFQALQHAVASAADVAAVCEAAAAALRVMPLLLQLQPQLRADAAATPDGMPALVAALPDRLLSLATSLLPAVNELNVRLTPTAAGQAVAVEAQAEPLFLLHTVAVRFLHWLRALDEGQLAAMPALGSWDMWHTMVHITFTEAVAIHRMGRTLAAEAGDTQQEAAFTRRLHSLCLAHAPLVPLLSDKTGRPFDHPKLGFFTELIFLVSYTPLAALDPQLVAGFERSVRSSLQASTAPGQLVEYVWQDVHKWLVEAEEQPQYCVFLLNSGLAQEGLAAAEAAAVATDMPLPSISRRLLATVHVCCCNLLAAAADEAGCFGRPSTGGGSDAAKPHMQGIPAACYALESALKRLPFDFPPPPSLATLRMYQRAVVPSAAALAHTLLAYWHSDEQLQAGRLAAARAAAARSCAYLHCANLDSEGGARGGTGVGSSRCSACKAAWYCGTACSHADWRADHKRMCKPLGEARAAERRAAERSTA